MAALLAAPLHTAQPTSAYAQPRSTVKEEDKKELPPPSIIVHSQPDPTTGQERIVRRFTVGRQLGKGAFGRCYEAMDMETKHLYAAKVITKASLTRKSQQAKVRNATALIAIRSVSE